MSNSSQPRGLKPTRLLHPWDFPGKNTGVDCHFLLQCMKVKSESEVDQSRPTLHNPMDCSLPGSSVHGIFQARTLEWSAIAFSRAGSRGTNSSLSCRNEKKDPGNTDLSKCLCSQSTDHLLKGNQKEPRRMCPLFDNNKEANGPETKGHDYKIKNKHLGIAF